MKKVGVQGIAGSFSEIAAQKLMAEEEFKAEFLVSSMAVVTALADGEIDYGVIAIENSIGGVVWESIYALAAHKVNVIKKIAIPISQNLLARYDVPLTAITEIHSHPQALKQAGNFIQTYCKEAILIPEDDTAICARRLANGEWGDTAAVVCSYRAADLYNLHIIRQDVQERMDNTTRFLLLSKGTVKLTFRS